MAKNIEEFKELLTDPDYVYYLHGTGFCEDPKYQAGVIASIFKNGLRASHNAMYWTTVFYGTGDDIKNNWSGMIDDMNHWQHKDSKDIIIVRFPIKYLIFGADDSLGEKDYAIYNEVTNPETEQVTRYITPKMVVGCYHAETGNFTSNPNFEKELSPETEKEFQEKYDEGVKEFQKRLSFDDVPIKKASQEEETEKEEDIPEESWLSFGDDWE